MRFWDTSAIVPLLVTEPNSARVHELLERDPDMAVWWGSPVECWSALVWADGHQAEFVRFDGDLRRAARLEGLLAG